MPVGLGGEGLPIALQLQAAWGRDELLLDAAEALERASGRRWVEALPPLARAEQGGRDVSPSTGVPPVWAGPPRGS